MPMKRSPPLRRPTVAIAARTSSESPLLVNGGPADSSSRADIPEVVDLAVEHHDVTAAWRDHRLAAAFGQIENRQSAMAKSDAFIQPHAAGVGTAMMKSADRILKG